MPPRPLPLQRNLISLHFPPAPSLRLFDPARHRKNKSLPSLPSWLPFHTMQQQYPHSLSKPRRLA